jgi:predicted  nucleic acid-binding Zn-ribbon protein
LLGGVVIATLSAAPAQSAPPRDADSLLIVDCLLPGRIQRLGNAMTYVTARRALKTSAADCRVRGGEYTESGEATYASLLRVWMPLANSGDAEAQTNLGEIFEKGVGGPPQPDQAVQWYQRAANSGFARAQVNLGSLYERGVGVPRDTAKAMEWYRRASGLSELSFGAASGAEVNQLRQERDSLSRQLDTERRRRQELETELNGVRQRLSGERSSLQQQQQQVAAARAELATRTQAVEQQRARVPAAGANTVGAAQLALLQHQLDEQRRTVADRDAQLGRLQTSVQGLEARSASLQTQLAATERQRTQDVAAARNDATAARQELAAVTERLRLANGELSGRVTTIDRQRNEVDQLRRQITEQQGRASASGADRATLEARLRQRETELAESRRQLGTLNAEIARLEEQTQTASRAATASTTTSPRVASRTPTNVNFGRYYALIIGNNEYRAIPKLRTAVGDAEAVATLLRTRYGFQTTLLLNADRYQLLSALNTMREKLTSEDNLLIYYAGHGTLDEQTDRGYWLPVDAEANSNANWIASYQVTDILKATSAKQVMLVADSCYSGILTRSAIVSLNSGMSDSDRQRWYQTMTSKHARVVLTSGGLQPVADVGGGSGHSVFAGAFLSVLQNNADVMEGQQLAQGVTQRVAVSAVGSKINQVPMYAPMSYAGHEAGDFFFVPK